jgi:hypothetical protein
VNEMEQKRVSGYYGSKTKTFVRKVKFKSIGKGKGNYPILKKKGLMCVYSKAYTDKLTGKPKLDKKGYGKVRYTMIRKEDFV